MQKPYLQFIQPVEDSELPPKGPLDLANSVNRLDTLMRLLVKQGNQQLMALDALASSLVRQQAELLPGTPRPLTVLPAQAPGIQTVAQISPALGHDPVQITVQAYKTITPLAMANPYRTQIILTNVGSNTFYFGFTEEVQPSGNPNMGTPLDPPAVGSKRGDLLTIQYYTGPIYATCDTGNTTKVTIQDVVTRL